MSTNSPKTVIREIEGTMDVCQSQSQYDTYMVTSIAISFHYYLVYIYIQYFSLEYTLSARSKILKILHLK